MASLDVLLSANQSLPDRYMQLSELLIISDHLELYVYVASNTSTSTVTFSANGGLQMVTSSNTQEHPLHPHQQLSKYK
jgi:hypothetical protein